MNNIVLLHVFSDSLIFSGPADNYDAIEGVRNLYYFYTPDQDYIFQNIHDERVVTIHNFKEYVSLFSDPTIDVIVFHSLPYSKYYLFDYIDEKKLVVWWAWGYDIYHKQAEYPPLVPLTDMYKPKTREFMDQLAKKANKLSFYRMLRTAALFPYSVVQIILCRRQPVPLPKKTQDEILRRIDYFYAPLDIEYIFMKGYHESFHAYLFQWPVICRNHKFGQKKECGNVLINHSLTYTDNHLDIFEYIYHIELQEGRKYIIPVSYGIDGYNGNPEILKKQSHLASDQTIWLTERLPYDEYRKVIDSASHAIYGTMRQQALGNIFMCLRTGVKVFLFKDSVVYKELKEHGYICFSIEDDLTTSSLSECLTAEDAFYNYNLYMERCRKYAPEQCRVLLENAIADKGK